MEIVFAGDHREPLHDCAYHKHRDWELALYRNGVGETIIDGVSYPFSPGALFLIPPFLPHRSIGDGLFIDRYVHIRDFTWSIADRPTLFLDDEHRLETLMWYLFAEFHGNGSNRTAIIRTLWETIHQILIAKSEDCIFPVEIEAFQTLLLKHLSDAGFSLSQAVSQTAYCDDHFRRLFKRYIGVTPAEYLSELRINYAKQLLLHEYPSHMKIAGVAHASGFSDPYYFARYFKKKTGCTPSEYSQHRDENDISSEPESSFPT